MQSLGEDEEDRDSAASADSSSDNDQDGRGDDQDDINIDGEGENDEENEENEDEDDEQDPEESRGAFGYPPNRGLAKSTVALHNSGLTSRSTSSQTSAGLGVLQSSGPTSHPNPAVMLTSPSPSQAPATTANGAYAPVVPPEMLTASVYDIVPTIAAPHSTSINAICAMPDLRWIFSGGTDGYIRRFDWHATHNGKSMLTVAQRHPFVDSVIKAGVLLSYWENEDTLMKSSLGDDSSSLSPVYSLAVHREALWLLSGLESGGINLQTVRHDEGTVVHCLRRHTSAVSVLNLAPDERSVLSGSWDKLVLDWDLDVGNIKRSFEGSGGQISALELRPLSSIPVPKDSVDSDRNSNTLSSNTLNKPVANSGVANSIDNDILPENSNKENGNTDDVGSPTDSLFVDSQFGDNDDADAGAPSAGNFVEEDDEFSLAIANGIRDHERENAGYVLMNDADELTIQPPTDGFPDGKSIFEPDSFDSINTIEVNGPSSLAGSLPHAEELLSEMVEHVSASTPSDASNASDSTFLAASIDGSLRIWDKRQAAVVAKITPNNVPPWCMNACWSPDGNFIYAGRRNGTVEEFSIHKGFRSVERSLKLPHGSGPVSAVRAMPNGRHLICASYDILRLYDLQQQQTFKHSTVPFLIVPGHRTGMVSQLYIDPTCRYMISTAGNRGWEGNSTEVLLGYEIGIGK